MKKTNFLIISAILLLCACGTGTNTTVRPDIPVEDNTVVVKPDVPPNSPDKVITCKHKYDSEDVFSYKIKDAVVHRITQDSSIYIFKNINIGNEQIDRTDRQMVNYNCYPEN